jgi:hypothetical protein
MSSSYVRDDSVCTSNGSMLRFTSPDGLTLHLDSVSQPPIQQRSEQRRSDRGSCALRIQTRRSVPRHERRVDRSSTNQPADQFVHDRLSCPRSAAAAARGNLLARHSYARLGQIDCLRVRTRGSSYSAAPGDLWWVEAKRVETILKFLTDQCIDEREGEPPNAVLKAGKLLECALSLSHGVTSSTTGG